VSQVEVALIGKLPAVDGLAARTVMVTEITALHHEALDDAVEEGVLEMQHLARSRTQTALARTQTAEVLGCDRHVVGEELDHYPTSPARADLDKRGWSAGVLGGQQASCRLRREGRKVPVGP